MQAWDAWLVGGGKFCYWQLREGWCREKYLLWGQERIGSCQQTPNSEGPWSLLGAGDLVNRMLDIPSPRPPSLSSLLPSVEPCSCGPAGEGVPETASKVERWKPNRLWPLEAAANSFLTPQQVPIAYMTRTVTRQ